MSHLGVADSQLHTIEPLGYLEFNYLVAHAKAVITDSGGITEETTVMGIPCMTLRDNTERPETIEVGTNELVGTNPKNIKPAMDKLFAGEWKKGAVPELWDGHTAERIVEHLLLIKEGLGYWMEVPDCGCWMRILFESQRRKGAQEFFDTKVPSHMVAQREDHLVVFSGDLELEC